MSARERAWNFSIARESARFMDAPRTGKRSEARVTILANRRRRICVHSDAEPHGGISLGSQPLGCGSTQILLRPPSSSTDCNSFLNGFTPICLSQFLHGFLVTVALTTGFFASDMALFAPSEKKELTKREKIPAGEAAKYLLPGSGCDEEIPDLHIHLLVRVLNDGVFAGL